MKIEIGQSTHLFPFELNKFESWSEMREPLFNENFPCVYRGHANAGWRLRPAIERIISPDKDRATKWADPGQEAQSVDEFMRASHHYTTQEDTPKSLGNWFGDREWLARSADCGA
jgi:hypothetical protein